MRDEFEARKRGDAMMGNEIGFEGAVPDRISDALLAEFQDDATRAVPRRRTNRVWPVLMPVGSPNVRLQALLLFCGLAVSIGLIGGIVYAMVAWPSFALDVAPAGLLFTVSLVIAMGTRSRWRKWSLW